AIRAVIIRSLGALKDRRARDLLAEATNDSEGVIRAEACRALGKIGLPQDVTLLARIMTVDNLEDCRIAAIEGIGSLKTKDPRILYVLLEGMEHDDPAIRLASVKALREITGKDLGVDPAVWRRTLQTQIAADAQPSGTPRPPAEGPAVT